MKHFFRYLYDCRYLWIYFLICGGLFAVIFALYDIRMEVVWYPLLLCTVIGALFVILGFRRQNQRHREMRQIDPDSGAFPEVLDVLPKPGTQTEADYQELLSRIGQSVREERRVREEERREMDDYYAVWVHQIKAPIAVMKVMLQQSDTQENRELASELFRIEQYADMALSYIRLGAGATDLVIQEYALDGIIRKAVRKYAGQFIRRKLRLVYEGTDQWVLTDAKWLSLMIEQLLSNAVKYTAEGTVTIKVDDRKQLWVTDTGIGISPEDLPRIFEKGYTGYNGRSDRKSTGIGLYLCRKAADKLGHKITVQSEPGKGSSFIIDLESYPFQAE